MSKIKWIDTSKTAEKVYNKIFEKKYSTVFLNGKWGSGKTTFLNEVFKNKGKLQCVVSVDLWRRANDSEVVQTFYKKLFPVSFYFLKGIVILFSLLMLGASFAIGNVQASETITLSLLVLGVIISLNTYILKIDWETFYFTVLKKRIKFQILNKIVVIDDFDRISQDTQEVLYKIFNSIKSQKIKLVFVGHYTNVSKSETSYLQKIIDERIELPFEIQPTNIWKQYNELLIKEMNDKRELEIKDNELEGLASLFSLAIKENRVIRELNKFSATVDSVLMDSEKYDKVNLDQQLVIIYLYEFHYNLYEKLISEIEFLLRERNRIIWKYSSGTIDKELTKIEQLRELVNGTFNFYNTELNDIVFLLFSEKNYPFVPFTENFPNYLINYQPNNLGSNKFMSLLQKENFEEITKMKPSNLEDFHYFITRNQNSSNNEFHEHLFRLSLYILQDNININYFFATSDNKSMILDKIAAIGLFTKYSKHLSYNKIVEVYLNPSDTIKVLDLSQRIRICNRYYGMGYEEINDRCSDLVLDGIENFSESYRHPSILLAVAFSLENSEIGIRIDLFQDIIEKISDEEFLYFLYYKSDNTNDKSKLKIKVANHEVFEILRTRLKEIDNSKLHNEFIIY